MSYFSGNKDYPHWGDFNFENEELGISRHQILMEESIKQKDSEKRKILQKINKITYSAQSNEEIIDLVLKRVAKALTKEAVIRYCQYEKLSLAISELTFSKQTLTSLVKQYCRSQGFGISELRGKEIQDTLDKIFINDQNKSVYERVGDIQKVIHSFTRRSCGTFDKEMMRQILSICRLFIGVIEFNTKGKDYLFNQILLNKKLDYKERHDQEKLYLGKKFIKNWKVRHLKSFAFFFNIKGRRAYSRVVNISPQLEVDELKNQIVIEIHDGRIVL